MQKATQLDSILIIVAKIPLTFGELRELTQEPPTRLNRYLDYLIKKGLINRIKANGESIYRISVKGLEYLFMKQLMEVDINV